MLINITATSTSSVGRITLHRGLDASKVSVLILKRGDRTQLFVMYRSYPWCQRAVLLAESVIEAGSFTSAQFIGRAYTDLRMDKA